MCFLVCVPVLVTFAEYSRWGSFVLMGVHTSTLTRRDLLTLYSTWSMLIPQRISWLLLFVPFAASGASSLQ